MDACSKTPRAMSAKIDKTYDLVESDFDKKTCSLEGQNTVTYYDFLYVNGGVATPSCGDELRD